MTSASSDPTSAWVCYLGPGDERALRRLLGDGAEVCTGAGYGLGIRSGRGEPAALIRSAGGEITARIGSDPDATCAATLQPSAPGAEQVLRGAELPLGVGLAAAPGSAPVGERSAAEHRRPEGRRHDAFTAPPPRLTLTRDPFGLHGVYTVQTGDTLWCASRLDLLRRLPGLHVEIEPRALHGYLCFSYVPTPHTLMAGVAALPAVRQITVIPAEPDHTMHDGWRETEPTRLAEDAAVAELRQRLQAAVARRVGEEREAAVFLSGGLDSSLIAALLVELGVKVHLFTLDFGPPFDAELPYAHDIAAHLGRPLHLVPARAAQIRGALRATAAALEQPFGDCVTVPLYLLGRAAAQHVGVVFNGEGGDQLFGGWTHKPMLAAEIYRAEGYEREAAYLATFHRFHGITDPLYTSRARAGLGDVDAGAWVRPALSADGFPHLLHRLRAANLSLKGAQNIAPRMVQLAAAHGLRVRAPFFDHSLTEWTFSLPPDWLLYGACEKHLLKRAAEPYLPPAVVWREKRGMGVPTTDWCMGPLRRDVARGLSPSRLRRDGWFAPAFIKTLLRGQDQPQEFRRRRLGEKLWTLLMLHLWLDTHDVRLGEVAPRERPPTTDHGPPTTDHRRLRSQWSVVRGPWSSPEPRP
jgi:asparagine synthase (glutamine-hydrolysing)